MAQRMSARAERVLYRRARNTRGIHAIKRRYVLSRFGGHADRSRKSTSTVRTKRNETVVLYKAQQRRVTLYASD